MIAASTRVVGAHRAETALLGAARSRHSLPLHMRASYENGGHTGTLISFCRHRMQKRNDDGRLAWSSVICGSRVPCLCSQWWILGAHGEAVNVEEGDSQSRIVSGAQQATTGIVASAEPITATKLPVIGCHRKQLCVETLNCTLSDQCGRPQRMRFCQPPN